MEGKYRQVDFDAVIYGSCSRLVRVQGILQAPTPLDQTRFVAAFGPEAPVDAVPMDYKLLRRIHTYVNKRVPVYGYAPWGITCLLQELQEQSPVTLSGKCLPVRGGTNCLYLHRIDIGCRQLTGFEEDKQFLSSFGKRPSGDPAARLMVILPDLDLDLSTYFSPPLD